MDRLNISGTDKEPVLALRPRFGVFRMEKQSAIYFKVKAKEKLAYGLSGGLAFASLILFRFALNWSGPVILITGLVTGVGIILFLYAIRTPVVHFIENGFYFRPALLSFRTYYAFDDIQHILPSDINNSVHFQLEDGQTIHLHLNHLNPKDHIRFIFLLESDVNRKHVLKSVAAHQES